MLAWMNREALERTLSSGRATFWSRSREQLWEKGGSSGNGLSVHSVYADCDADALLLLTDPLGPSCHTGSPSCFFHRVKQGSVEAQQLDAQPFLAELERTLAARATTSADRSYTRSLLDGGAAKIAEKLGEEAGELGHALSHEDPARVASEAADLAYHTLVGLLLRGVDLRTVVGVLADRFGVSGHQEKASRG